MYNIQESYIFNKPEYESFDWAAHADELEPAAVSELPEYGRYFDRWVKYWPRREYHVKRAYDGGFYRPKTKLGNDAGFYDELIVRHLDNATWAASKGKPNMPFWLGMQTGRKTTVNALDYDAKDHWLASYRRADGVLRPVVCPDLDWFKGLKRLYDAFPDRVWCVSSETLGLHAWERHALWEQRVVHTRTKRFLARIGMEHVEVHPMVGRCQRRPFGRDYRTITPSSVIFPWDDQSAYFEDDGRTPEFELIVGHLVSSVRLQVRLYRSSDDQFSGKGGKYKLGSLNPVEGRLSEVEAWRDRGYTDLAVNVPVVVTQVVEEESSAVEYDAQVVEALESSSRVVESVRRDLGGPMPHLRDGDWAVGLRALASGGLVQDDTVGVVLHELAKWLYWVELFDLPAADRKVRVVELLDRYVSTKHNGFVTRINNGQEHLVRASVRSAVESAVRLDPSQRSASLERFALYRQNRASGRYSPVIYLAPLLEGESSSSAPSSGSRKVVMRDDRLPDDVEGRLLEIAQGRRMRRRDGEYPMIRFARRFLNALWDGKGRARINRETCLDMSGSKDQNLQLTYKQALASSGLIRYGWENTIRRGKSAALYRMTDS